MRRLLTSIGLMGTLACSSPPPAPAPPAPSPPPPPAPPGSYDVIIEGGRIVDGSGNAWYAGDLGIRGDRIEAITLPGRLRDASATRRVDATGKVVAPGFIDIQSQSRFNFLASGDGRSVSKVMMGVTTEIMGESTTNAPSTPDMLRAAGRAAGVTQFATFGDWMAAMEAHGASVNFGSFVGASTIRAIGMGQAMGEAGSPERRLMQLAVRESMEQGAFGVASALIYPPGAFATTDELISVNAAAAPYGGIYVTHLRSEGDRLLEAIDEAIEIGTRAGVPVEIYHLKAAGRDNWHKAGLAVAKIDSARAAGVDIQANMYPYTAGSTSLTACFPPSASAGGRLFQNLGDSRARARIRTEIERPTTPWENLCRLATPEGTLLLGLNRPAHRRFVGRYLADVARELGKDWIETAFDLVREEGQGISTAFFMMSEENVAMQIGVPWMKFGTDASGWDPAAGAGRTHPRAYGTFARVLGRYVRDDHATSLEDAVRKMSAAVATRLRIRERGLLQEGFYADVIVFDPITIGDQATYERPHALATGVEQVFVNGQAVVVDGVHTGALAGRALRGPGWVGWQ
jgi:N-acyl-D-amino-acid deacylase